MDAKVRNILKRCFLEESDAEKCNGADYYNNIR